MKFLIVDDHALIRDAMHSVLRGLRSGATVLEAANAEAALRCLADHPDTDLVLLDLHLPDQDDLQLLATVVERHPAVAVVMLSGDMDQATMRRALDLGAQGYIPKGETREVLTSALALVLAGGVYVPRAALRGAPSSSLPVPAAAAPANPSSANSLGLTDRQLEVLALLMQGKNNKLICRALDLAEPTVKNHVSAILRALGVGSRTEAVLAVTRLGLTLPRVE
ncbi:response regulator [Leptothrix discophora]|uniref:Response regulator transcription factor n=1 Tax=Leptothrix discophora TaxID=89 RepID=A0ABT9G853_LEPDI|nr:response regulator transcription factor [Leptothrix discophora]MDP4302661.1 response regulator transcription factor [Leptothrix discophora]